MISMTNVNEQLYRVVGIFLGYKGCVDTNFPRHSVS